ncbi:MAG: exonuclease SbcCD subunit D [Halobacteria archaeon]
MRIAHISDTHLGFRQYNLDQREEDFYRAWHKAIGKMIEERVDAVVHSGDLFDDRKPPIKALVEARRGVRKLKEAGIPFYYVTGNHDQPTRAGALPPQALLDEALPLDAKPAVLGGLFIGGVSYHSRVSLGPLKDRMALLAGQARSARRSVMVLHQGLDRYIPEFELRLKELNRFDYYALGHVHLRTRDWNGSTLVAYPGSIEMWRMDEFEDWRQRGKGFTIVDLDGDVPETRFVNVEVRTFLREEAEGDRLDETLAGLKPRCRGAVVCLDVRARRSDFARLAKRISEELGPEALRVLPRFLDAEAPESAEVLEGVDLRDSLRRALADSSEAERGLAWELYQLLARNDVEGALQAARRWLSPPAPPPVQRPALPIPPQEERR